MMRIGSTLTQVERISVLLFCALIMPSDIKITNCGALRAGLQKAGFLMDK